MKRAVILALVGGACLCMLASLALTGLGGAAHVARIEDAAAAAIARSGGRGVEARFVNRLGWVTRHPVLVGGERLSEDQRMATARAVAAVPGVGGVRWERSSAQPRRNGTAYEPLHCQRDVEGLLKSRSIRFEEASAALLPASGILLDEVAAALRPCLGAIIAITGHTDRSGAESANVALSLERARAVREALVRRGIPRDGLRARGVGSQRPVGTLAATDPANRRIEFSVIRKRPLTPTPVDTPGGW